MSRADRTILTAAGSIDRRSFLQLAGLTAGASALGAGLAGGAAAAEPFRIGWVRPTTGRLVTSFNPLYMGGVMAVEEINAAGGILGRQIERVEEDDEALPSKEPGIVRKLRGAGIHYVVGPTGSSQSLSSIAATTAAKMIQATYAAAAEAGDGKRYPYHYQLLFNTDQQAEICVDYMLKNQGLKKIGILQENTAFGEQATASTVKYLKKAGVEPASVQVYPINAPDLAAYVSNLQKAGVDGVIAWIANIPNAAMIFNTMKSLNWFPPVTGHSGLFLPSLFELVSPEAVKNVYGTYYKSFTWNATEQPGERQVAFAKKLAEIPGAKNNEVNIAASPYYDFVYLLKHAIEQTKSFEVADIKKALDSTKDFPGLLGKVSFTPENHSGIALADITLASVSSGVDKRAVGCMRERAPGL